MTLFFNNSEIIDSNKLDDIKNIIFKSFNKENYIIRSNKEINEVLSDFKIDLEDLDKEKYSKIGKILNSDIFLFIDFKKVGKINSMNISCIKLENEKSLFKSNIFIKQDINSDTRIIRIFKSLHKKFQNEVFTLKSQDEELVKRTVMILPFYNSNKIKKYNYLADVMRDALRSDLLKSEKFLFTDFSLIKDEIIKSNDLLDNIIEEKKAKDLALKLKADVIVIGKYTIIKDNIMINISAIDVLKDQVVASTNINSELGIEVFSIVNKSAEDITKKMTMKIKMVTKSYLQEMLELQTKQVLEDESKYWKRHFINLTFVSGLSMHYQKDNIYYGQLTPRSSRDELGFGGHTGLAFGYLYGFNKNFGFGPGLSGFFAFVWSNVTIYESTGVEYESGMQFYGSSGAFLFQFMWGDIKEKKIAFLFDIGGGIFFTTKLGLYAKGFVFKIGYTMSYFYYCHSFSLDFGYMFNFKRKRRINKDRS